MNALTLLIRYLRPFRSRVWLLTGLLLGGITLQLAAPLAVRRFLDMAQTGAAGGVLLGTAVFFFVAVTSQKVLALLTTYVSEDLGWAATNQLRVDLAEHCLRLDMPFHKTHTPGELIERVDGDVSALAEYFSELIIAVVGNGLLAVGILALLFREDWRVGAIGLVYTVLVLVFLRLIHNWVVGSWGNVRQGFAELFGFLEERLAGLEDIRANGGEAYVMMRLYGLMRPLKVVRVRLDVMGNTTFAIGFLLYTLSVVATLGFAATAYLNGQMTIGTVFLLVAYVNRLEGPLNTIRWQIANLQRALASIGRIQQLFQIQPQVREQVTAELPHVAPVVRFEGVSFGYKDAVASTQYSVLSEQSTVNSGESPISSSVLQNIAFTLEAGRVLGVLGRTGSGKTTLTRLLFRLYEVDNGRILLNNINVRDVALSDLRQQVGVVTQDVQLFAATVRDNLTLFRSHQLPAVSRQLLVNSGQSLISNLQSPISDEQILVAIETLGLGGWYRALPNGLDTVLATGGQGLSAGEAQLLAFTRVFLRNPKLVILDEASSRLDPATEQLLERAIDRLLENRTAIIIAHRLKTVQRADDILILEDGRILENGRRLELVQNPESRFYKLLQTGLEELLA